MLIVLRADEWLKRAALVWRAVERIVPLGYDPKDSRTARVLAQNGILVNLNPADSASEIGDQFLVALADRADDIRERHGLTPEERALRVDGGVHPEFLDVPATKKLAWVHVAKVDPNLKAALSESELAVVVQDWIGMRIALLEVYMAALAGDLARSGRCDAVTDQPRANLLTGRWSAEELASMLVGEAPQSQPVSADEAEYRLALCAVELAAPDLAHTSVEDIVAIRDELRSDFGAFRTGIHTFQEQLARELEGVTDRTRVDQIVRDVHAETIAVENAKLAEALSITGLTSVTNLIGVQVSVVLGRPGSRWSSCGGPRRRVRPCGGGHRRRAHERSGAKQGVTHRRRTSSTSAGTSGWRPGDPGLWLNSSTVWATAAGRRDRRASRVRAIPRSRRTGRVPGTASRARDK